MKKSIYIIIISALVSSLLTTFAYWLINQPTRENNNIVKADVAEIRVKEIDYDIPDFTMSAIGLVKKAIIKETVNNIQAYEISADISDCIYLRHYTYKGIKVKDVITSIAKNYDDYNKVIFKSTGGLQVEYQKEEINDDLFFVFEKDGIKYPATQEVALLNPTVYDRYNITNVKILNFE